MDLQRLREDTPATQDWCHFNNAGSSLPCSQVVQAGKDYLDLEASLGGYEAVDASAEALQRPYTALARLLNCQPDEIAVLQSATLAWQQVFYGLALTAQDRVLTSVAEYGSNFIAFLQVAKRTGVRVEVVPEDEKGDIDLAALEAAMTAQPRPALVAITHIPTSSGRVYNAAGVGRIARRHGVPYLLDACQSVGQMPIDVQEIGCDWLSGTSRKYLRGPRGAGFLFASREIMAKTEPAMLDLLGGRWTANHGYEAVPTAKRYESYEMSFAAKVALGVAVEYALALGMSAIQERVCLLASLLRQGLAEMASVQLQDRGRQLCGIVSFTKDGVGAAEVKQRLHAERINVSVSAIGSTRLDFDKRKLTEVVRASVHYFNTGTEVQLLLEALRRM